MLSEVTDQQRKTVEEQNGKLQGLSRQLMGALDGVQERLSESIEREVETTEVMLAGRREGAVRQIALIMAGMMRGQLGVAVQAMRMGQARDRRKKELVTMYTAGEEQVRSAAVREMRAIMVRLARGEVAMRVEVWRSNRKAWLLMEGEALKAKLRSRMRTHAMAHLTQTITRMFKGDILLKVRSWWANSREELSISAVVALRSRMKGHSVSMLSRVADEEAFHHFVDTLALGQLGANSEASAGESSVGARGPDDPDRETWQTLLDLDSDERGWQSKEGNDLVKVETRTGGQGKPVLVRARMTLPGQDVERVLALIMDPKLRMSWDQLFDKVVQVEAIDEEAEIVYSRLKKQPMAKVRDSVHRRRTVRNYRGTQGLHLILMEDSEHAR